MKRPLAVGDRVSAQFDDKKVRGVVRRIYAPSIIILGDDGIIYRRAQWLCKRLIKKPKRKPSTKCSDCGDLVQEPRTIWINEYPGQSDGDYHPTKDIADKHHWHGRIACTEFREVIRKPKKR